MLSVRLIALCLTCYHLSESKLSSRSARDWRGLETPFSLKPSLPPLSPFEQSSLGTLVNPLKQSVLRINRHHPKIIKNYAALVLNVVDG